MASLEDPLERLLQFMHGLAVFTNPAKNGRTASVECNFCSNGDFLFKEAMPGDAIHIDEMLPLFFAHMQAYHPKETLELIG